MPAVARSLLLAGAVLCAFLLPALFLVSCGGACSRGGGGSGGSASGESPELSVPQPPAMLTGDSLRMAWMAAHYWDNLDWGDGRWIADTAALEGYFTPWAQLLAQMQESEAAKFSGALFRKGNDYPDMQLRLLDAAEYFWRHPNSPFRSEELFIPALEAIVAAPGIEDIYKVRPRSQLASALRNRPGTRAADFAYTTGDGTQGTLLMFYNPDCPECGRIEEYIPRSEVFAPLIASGRLRVLAIYPDEDIEAWREHLPQMPAGWTVGHAPMEKDGTAAYHLPGFRLSTCWTATRGCWSRTARWTLSNSGLRSTRTVSNKKHSRSRPEGGLSLRRTGRTGKINIKWPVPGPAHE